jgi:DNA primase
MGQYFTKETLRRLRNEVLITKTIQVLDIPAKTRDGYLRFLCPLCNEFMTACHPKTNLARCFRCERNFNPIDLVMVVKGLCFQEAVQFLLAYEKSTQKGGKDAE